MVHFARAIVRRDKTAFLRRLVIKKETDAQYSDYTNDIESIECGVFVGVDENEGWCVCWVICAQG